MLYPLKFKPILKTAIWGGHRLPAAGKKVPRRLAASADRISESWEISGVRGNLSVAANGFLKSNNLEELTEVYMGDLVGDKIYERYGLEFPVLVKFIDARERLSLQVHPDDELAARHHGCRGKAEMWYVVDCEPDAAVYIGFNRPVSREEYLRAVADGTLTSLLGRYRVRKGDIYYVPAGTIHTIGPGILIAEIQETSDVSYRISDWDRVDADGRPRALHTEEAAEAISFGPYGRTPLHGARPTQRAARGALHPLLHHQSDPGAGDHAARLRRAGLFCDLCLHGRFRHRPHGGGRGAHRRPGDPAAAGRARRSPADGRRHPAGDLHQIIRPRTIRKMTLR